MSEFEQDEYQLDEEIGRLQAELLQAKQDEKNLEIALKIVHERQQVDIQFKHHK